MNYEKIDRIDTQFNYDYLIVGAGLSGAVLAERLATDLNKKILVIDKRDHIAGNCYDYIDDNGILINKYGAHIFHTNYENVWDYINKFSEWVRYDHKVLSIVDNKFVPVPVNINTVNSICKENIKDENEMNEWLLKNQVKYDCEITNSEQIAKSRVGNILYDKMFCPYTIKQWNKNPNELNTSVLGRIPIRNNFDDRYFSDKYQYLPKYGYTKFIENILNNKNITVLLSTDFFDLQKNNNNNIVWNTLIYTGQIDAYFNRDNKDSNGKIIDKSKCLEYRSIDFQIETIKNINYFQPVPVVNYPSLDVPYTRIVEYKHFLNQKSSNTTIVKEITTDEGEPYYPVPTPRNIKIYEEYRKLANEETNAHFIGRLANYKYFNMDEAINNALEYYEKKFKS
jgi:UDP-galactopyranose mutase